MEVIILEILIKYTYEIIKISWKYSFKSIFLIYYFNSINPNICFEGNMKNNYGKHVLISKTIFKNNSIVLSFFFWLMLLSTATLNANNLIVSQTAYLVEKNTSLHSIKVKFDLSWENSWKVNSAPNNWDAAWLFIKFKVNNSEWKHATLDTILENFTVTNNNSIPATFNPTNAGKGVFITRLDYDTGNNNLDCVKLRWNYGLDGVGDNDSIQVKVFAIEMVYVPQGGFHLGSGGSDSAHFYTYPSSSSTYMVNSENALNVGTTTGNLYYTPSNYTGDGLGPIPATFPKGFKAFYCMKYEITQEQYAEFLNSLTATQKSARYFNNFNNYRYYIKLVNGIYGCDGNNNGILNEADDGQNIACNWLSYSDGAAYADWSGLRPMTELEYEKACRGTASPISNEYAWGNATLIAVTSISNPRTTNEEALPSNANCVSGNFTQGPMRVGNFARSSSNRQQSGGSYYGIMELSCNLWERIITVGNPTGRSFTGLNGDGILGGDGNANVTGWPSGNSVGSGYRGGDWNNLENSGRVSDRIYAAYISSIRFFTVGFRCCIIP